MHQLSHKLLLLACFLVCSWMNAHPARIDQPEQPTRTISGATPTTVVQAAPTTAPAQNLFPIGVIEDGNFLGSNTAQFETMLNDLRAHGLDSVLFTNNRVNQDEPLLAVSDRLGLNIFMMPNGDLDQTWWSPTITPTIELARTLAQPIVAAWGAHPSLKGYVVIDEPFLEDTTKAALMTQALREFDPTRITTMNLIGLSRIAPIYAAAKPDVMLLDVYPVAKNNVPCDLTMNGFGYPQYDFVSYIRAATATRSVETPLWLILQTHSYIGSSFSLRTPSPTEVRLQQWLALGEGATGIYWFVYSTQQSWVGLVDNLQLYDEVKTQTQRLLPLRSLLLNAHKVPDRFRISGNGTPYISTLESKDGKRTFAIAVNRDCQHAQNLSITLDQPHSMLRDVETGTIYRFGEAITFKPGDGRIFEVVNAVYLPTLFRLAK